MPWNLADSYILDVGSLSSGSLSDTYADNGVYFTIAEVVGNPGWDLKFYFEGLDVNMTSFFVHLNGYYQGNPAHLVKIQKWNYTLSQWDNFTSESNDFPSRSIEDDYSFETVNTDYVSGQQFRIRIYHNWNGSAGHYFNVDYLWLESGVALANDPEIIFKREEVQKVFKHEEIQKVFKREEVQKVFKYQIKTTVK